MVKYDKIQFKTIIYLNTQFFLVYDFTINCICKGESKEFGV